MCIVSSIGDQVGTAPWSPQNPYPGISDWPYKKQTESPIQIPSPPNPPKDLNGLQIKAVVEWLEKLDKILIAARAFDEATGQPDCETDEKMAALKALAEQFGVDMEFFR